MPGVLVSASLAGWLLLPALWLRGGLADAAWVTAL